MTPSPQTTEGLGATPLTAEPSAALRIVAYIRDRVADEPTLAWPGEIDDILDDAKLLAADTRFAAARLSVPSEALAGLLNAIEEGARTSDHFTIEDGPAFARGARWAAQQVKARLAALPNREDAPEPPDERAGLCLWPYENAGETTYCGLYRGHPTAGVHYGHHFVAESVLPLVREDAPSREGLDLATLATEAIRDLVHTGWSSAAQRRAIRQANAIDDRIAALAATPPGDRHTPECSSRFARDGVTGEAICDCGVEEAAVATAEAAAREEGS